MTLLPGESPRLMFLPVSGPAGSGEYIRCLTIARAAQQRWPELSVSFVLDRSAPYAASVPFPAHLIDGSPTRNTTAVNELLRRQRPDVVVFDSAGRTAQVACASRLGARVVYVSRGRAKRRKAFRVRWLRRLDQHWVAYPTFVDGPLSGWERLKLRLFGNVQVVFLGTIFPESRDDRRLALLRSLGLEDQGYLLVIGGGLGRHPGRAAAPEVFAAAAAAVAQSSKVRIVLVASHAVSLDDDELEGVTVVPAQAPEHLIDLVHDAELVVCNGGMTLIQSLAHGKPCVAVPVASDQNRRVRRCARQGLVVAAPLEAGEIAARVLALLDDPETRASLSWAAAATGLDNGVGRALDALATLLESQEP